MGRACVSLGGIVGGEGTGCDEATSAVFIECALFDPVRVAESGRRLGILSDARARFERGVDPALMPRAVEAVSRMILDLCGGEASDIVAAGAEPAWQRSARLRFARLAELGGLTVPAGEAVAILERLGFGVERQDEASVTVAVPSWRNDIAAGVALDLAPDLTQAAAEAMTEAAATVEPEVDLVEEVLRISGLDTVPPVSLPQGTPVPAASLDAAERRARSLRGASSPRAGSPSA